MRNSDAYDYIVNRRDFRGSAGSFRSETLHDGTYVVYSYSTVIAIIPDPDTIYVNTNRYSVTTTRHQKVVREASRCFRVIEYANADDLPFTLPYLPMHAKVA